MAREKSPSRPEAAPIAHKIGWYQTGGCEAKAAHQMELRDLGLGRDLLRLVLQYRGRGAQGDGPPQPSPAPSVHPTPNPNAGATDKWLFGLLKRKKLVFPSYLPNSKTPKLTKPGLSFVIDTRFKDGIQLTVHGAFSTITKAHYIPETITTHIFADGKKHKVGAVVPLTLAIVGLDWDVPIRFDWAIPVYSNQKIQPGAPLQGYFALDVLAKAGNKLPAGDYVAYVVMEGNIYGPVKFKWLSPGDKP